MVRSVPSNSSTGTAEGEVGGTTRISEEGNPPWVSQEGQPTDPVDDSDSDSDLGDDPELLDDEANKIQEVAEDKVGHFPWKNLRDSGDSNSRRKHSLHRNSKRPKNIVNILK